MINIRELLEKRIMLSFGGKTGDEWLNEVINSDAEDVAIITTDNFGGLNRVNGAKRDVILEKYNVSAMFDLSNPLMGKNVNMFLYVLTNHYVDEVKTGIYKKRIEKKDKMHRGVIDTIHIIDEFPENYAKYISLVEDWINEEQDPEETANYSFNKCDTLYIEKYYLSPQRYTMQVLEIRELLKKEQVISLSEVAKIIKPRIIQGESVKIITPASLQYPLQYEDLKEGGKTDTPLMQVDIIFKGSTTKLITQ